MAREDQSLRTKLYESNRGARTPGGERNLDIEIGRYVERYVGPIQKLLELVREKVEVLNGDRGNPEMAALRRADFAALDASMRSLINQLIALYIIDVGAVPDGNKGDITVASSGATWTINAGAVGTSKLGGDITAAGKALLDDANAAAQRTTLELGSAATQPATAFEASGTMAAHVAAADPHTQYQLEAERNVANGYAGLDASGRATAGADTTDDVIVDDATKGVVLKSPNGHYWRLTVSDAGALSAVDLGTTKP